MERIKTLKNLDGRLDFCRVGFAPLSINKQCITMPEFERTFLGGIIRPDSPAGLYKCVKKFMKSVIKEVVFYKQDG